MEDHFGRKVDYLRVSITDKCNLRCRYCMPEEGITSKDHREILRLEEVERIVGCAVRQGIKSVRFTGGEPLIRKNLPELIKRLSRLDGLSDLSLTTNATLLSHHAAALKASGLCRVNVSLDTLVERKFTYITRRGRLAVVKEGLEACLAVGLSPVKINVVVIRGFNDDEIMDFVRLAIEKPFHIRFIEAMPVGEWSRGGTLEFLSIAEIKRIIAQHFLLEEPGIVAGYGPATYVKPSGAAGTIGFIGAMSEHFCGNCNRLRLTADGFLRACLLEGGEVDIKTPLRGGAGDAELEELFQKVLLLKPRFHQAHVEAGRSTRLMSQIGG